jgi:hypothetical protein
VGFSVARLSFTRVQSKPKPNSINHSDLSVIFVQPQNVSTLLGLSPKLPTLKTIVALGEIPEAARKLADAWGKERGVRILTLSEGRDCIARGPSAETLQFFTQSKRSGKIRIYPLRL